MTAEAALGTNPIPALGLVTMAASRTPGTRSPLRPGEARDACLCAFMREVIDIFAVFPLGHPLVVFAPATAIAHPMRIADEKARNLMRLAELDDLPRSLVAQVADAPLDPRARGPNELIRQGLATLVTQPSDVIALLDADAPGRAVTRPEVGRDLGQRRPSPGTPGRSL